MKNHLILCLALGTAAGFAISPSELQSELAGGSAPTVIDVRANDLFAKNHIPGAINIPAALCGAKNLPRLGRVVVYDAGLGVNEASGAMAALNAKPGIQAEALDGGFAAWESLNSNTTQGQGVEMQAVPMITYDQVKTNAADDLVLVDLRQITNAASATAKYLPGKSTQPLSDLQSAFPQARVTHSPFGVKSTKKSASGATVPPLLVLVDRGDGTAQQMARTLRANGITRFVILAGGEDIIARQGQSGLQRSSTSATVNGPIPTK
jgi:rhodanese-related sulfurtransferase